MGWKDGVVQFGGPGEDVFCGSLDACFRATDVEDAGVVVPVQWVFVGNNRPG